MLRVTIAPTILHRKRHRKGIAMTILKRGMPTTFTLMHQRYYSDMGYWRQQKWEKARTAATPDVQTALDALSSTPGRHNGNAASCHEYLGVQRECEGVLREEFVQSTERAKQSKVMFRKKRSVLARACNRLLDTAFANVTKECLCPPEGGQSLLVIGVGDDDFQVKHAWQHGSAENVSHHCPEAGSEDVEGQACRPGGGVA